MAWLIRLQHKFKRIFHHVSKNQRDFVFNENQATSRMLSLTTNRNYHASSLEPDHLLRDVRESLRLPWLKHCHDQTYTKHLGCRFIRELSRSKLLCHIIRNVLSTKHSYSSQQRYVYVSAILQG